MDYNLFINALKGQFNCLNVVLVLVVSAFVFHKMNRKVASRVFAACGMIFFLLASTAYLPQYLVNKIESRFKPFDISAYPLRNTPVFVHVLGGGYTADPRLPSNAQMSLVSLARLAEGLRICNLIDNSVLIVSGNIASGEESMASVVCKSAVEMGFDRSRIELLETPGTTEEEAAALVNLHGRQTQVIVVTDAIHLPRAMKFFREKGIEPYPGPTNYLVKKDDNPFALRWMPAVENFLLMDRVIREYLGLAKGYLGIGH